MWSQQRGDWPGTERGLPGGWRRSRRPFPSSLRLHTVQTARRSQGERPRTSLPPATARLSVPSFLHYCWPRVWTTRPLRAQQHHGSEPLDSPGLGYREGWAGNAMPSFQKLLTDKLCLAWLLPAVRGGRLRHSEEECLVQGHEEVGTQPEAVGRGVKVPGPWSLVDLDSNPSSVAYQRGAPGHLRAPRPPHQRNRTKSAQPRVSMKTRYDSAHGGALWDPVVTALRGTGQAPPDAGLGC